jgi:hypothetical protein
VASWAWWKLPKEKKRAFTDYDELWKILNSQDGQYLTERRDRDRKKKKRSSRSLQGQPPPIAPAGG